MLLTFLPMFVELQPSLPLLLLPYGRLLLLLRLLPRLLLQLLPRLMLLSMIELQALERRLVIHRMGRLLLKEAKLIGSAAGKIVTKELSLERRTGRVSVFANSVRIVLASKPSWCFYESDCHRAEELYISCDLRFSERCWSFFATTELKRVSNSFSDPVPESPLVN